MYKYAHGAVCMNNGTSFLFDTEDEAIAAEYTWSITALTVLFMNEEEDLWFDHHEVTFEMRVSKVESESTDIVKIRVLEGEHTA